MTLQLHRPDGEGGLEPRAGRRARLARPAPIAALGHALRGGRLPALKNPEMNPTSRLRSVLFWAGLGVRDVRAARRRLRHGLLEPQARADAGAERIVIQRDIGGARLTPDRSS